MASLEYKPLDQDDLESKSEVDLYSSHEVSTRWQRIVNRLILIALAGSVVLNSVLVYERFHDQANKCKTKYGSWSLSSVQNTILTGTSAGLVADKPHVIFHDSRYSSHDMKIQQEAWEAPEMLQTVGMVALSDEYVMSKGLPEAMRWPWDDSKSIYILNSFHTLHCLAILRKIIQKAYDGRIPDSSIEHSWHCIDAIREEIMCYADDTPRYTGRFNAEKDSKDYLPIPGLGQTRTCNDWNGLVEWANERSACYKYINGSDPDFPTLERYKFCPDGSEPWLDM
ncbi:Phenylalanine aminomutase (L-beta-phenylalanine forming) [Lachnellula suecica]|uniref:Phenylalanine aminomutase (L-beta-phenylalanine forming) n=1 Tax=Lachnellula suecica TaxID=602035 RepID=A0A8T9CDU4_9HELO|nr:Phenylalanine aminomutase (L-beta-phenylalanine forming) [Lachnellula suecica]